MGKIKTKVITLEDKVITNSGNYPQNGYLLKSTYKSWQNTKEDSYDLSPALISKFLFKTGQQTNFNICVIFYVKIEVLTLFLVMNNTYFKMVNSCNERGFYGR